MSTSTTDIDFSDLQQRRQLLQSLRQQVTERHEAGQNPIEICQSFSNELDDLLRAMLTNAMAEAGITDADNFCVVCVGGNGRQRTTPWSDVDLLLVTSGRQTEDLEQMLSAFVRDCWDTGLQLGHSLRTPDDVVRFAIADVPFATSLVDMRHLMGSEDVFVRVHDDVQRRVFRDPVDRFVNSCVDARREEWQARGDCVNQLEPDVKKSPGGLRDLHLIAWVTHAKFGDSHPSSLLEHLAIRTKELAFLNDVDRFLTGLRLELHVRTQQKQDVLTRDLQLQIVRSQGQDHKDPRRAVEGFMREYFQNTSRLYDLACRVAECPARPTLLNRIANVLLPSRHPKGFVIHEGLMTATPEYCQVMRDNPELVMRAFSIAAEHKIQLSAPLRKLIGKIAPKLPVEPSRRSCSLFRKILRSGHGLPLTLRAMFETEVLDWLIPQVAEIRCLMQFNQYHSYTVDEHTLKTIDEVVGFVDDESPVGSAYNSLRHKATLHLSLILHDIAKGRDGDHSIIGEKVAEEVAVRLQTPENKKRMIMALVRQHLVMPDLAFRRDISDESLLVDFARQVGSPELLRMLYVLSVADIRAVGPDTWNDWKADLMADLYNRTMQILSGRPFNHLERERLDLVINHVRRVMLPDSESLDDQSEQPVELRNWIDRQIDVLPPFYLMMEDPDRIAEDLGHIQKLSEHSCRIVGIYDQDTDTVTYRIFASNEYENGCFQRIAGVMSGLRMNILAAQLCRAGDGTVLGAFTVNDNDFIGEVSEYRIQEVSQALTQVVTRQQTVDHFFSRSGLFQLKPQRTPINTIEPSVTIDNDCSETHTVIDVFAMDNPGLLYTLARTLNAADVSVDLTRIATNVDQVVDVFYVVDGRNKKIHHSERLEQIRDDLLQAVRELESQIHGKN